MERKTTRPLLIAAICVCLVRPGSARPKPCFNEDMALAFIARLSASEFEGRACGTRGNESAMAYIAEQFHACGLRPLPGLDSYYQRFICPVPVLESTPVLEVLDRTGRVVRRYGHRREFREITAGYSTGGEAVGVFKTARGTGRVPAQHDGLILLDAGDYQVGDDRALSLVDLKAVIIRQTEETVRRKSLSLYGRPAAARGLFLKLAATPQVLKELVEYSQTGHRLRIEADLSLAKVETANVVGLLPGAGVEPGRNGVLVLCAHLDHVGRDPGGAIFPGALDNASGVAAMLTVMRTIRESGLKLRKTIIFAAFNAEESTLGGSAYFAAHLPFPAMTVAGALNLDMLGARVKNPPVCLSLPSAGARSPAAIAARLRALAAEWGFSLAQSSEQSSDHASFAPAGIPAVTLNDYGDCHVTADDIGNIDKVRLDEQGETVAKYVMEEVF